MIIQNKESHADLNERFISSLRRFQTMLRDLNIERSVSRADQYQSDALVSFPNLSLTDKLRCLDELENFVASCEEVIAMGHTIDDTPALIWQLLRKMGYVPKFDFFDKTETGDVIVAYDLSNRQVFRNIEYFRYSSHSLEDLFSLRWDEISTRNPEIEARLLQLVSNLISEKMDQSLVLDVPEHSFDEINSRDLLRCSLNLKAIVPLHRERNLAALLVITRCKLVHTTDTSRGTPNNSFLLSVADAIQTTELHPISHSRVEL